MGVVLLFGMVYIACCFIAHYLYRPHLWKFSIEVAMPFLQTAPKWIIKTFAWTFWFLDGGVYMWMLMFFAFFNRAASLYLFLAACTLGWLSEMLKMYYSDG